MRKKAAISFTAAIMLFAVFFTMIFGISANAENEPTFIISETVNSDNTLTAVISFTPDVSAAGTIKIKYNKDTLELKSADEGSVSAQVTINSIKDSGVNINFMSVEEAVKGNTELAVIKFSIKSDEFSAEDIYSESFKLYDINSALLSDNTKTSLKYDINTENTNSASSTAAESKQESKIENSTESKSENSSELNQLSSQNDDKTSENESIINSENENSEISENLENSDISEISKNPEFSENENQNYISNSESSTPEQSSENKPSEVSENDTANNTNNKNTAKKETTDNTLLTVFVICAVSVIAGIFVFITIRKQRLSEK